MNTKETIVMKQGRSSASVVLGSLFLMGSTAASLVLAGTKLGLYTHAPGCGLDSGCDAVANGPWGSVPVLMWPVGTSGDLGSRVPEAPIRSPGGRPSASL